MAIRSQSDLFQYLSEMREVYRPIEQLSLGEIEQIASSAVFAENGQSIGLFAGPLLDKIPSRQFELLNRELGTFVRIGQRDGWEYWHGYYPTGKLHPPCVKKDGDFYCAAQGWKPED